MTKALRETQTLRNAHGL